MSAVANWTSGAGGILYQHCAACGHAQYFRRAFCAACGGVTLEDKQASGWGVVHAVTVVHRAATEATRAHVPYAILLVDMAEGFRIMAHGANDLKIGESVVAGFRDFTGKPVPYFERT